jgi:DNA-directed RNA polymerase III subunit RPC6
MTKILKILEQRSLIKSVRSVVSKSKKLYMIYEASPAKEITGGPWYSDQEFDHEFVLALSNFIVQTVKANKMLDLTGISDKVRISGISTVTSPVRLP